MQRIPHTSDNLTKTIAAFQVIYQLSLNIAKATFIALNKTMHACHHDNSNSG
jgi:hypothetical protein